MRLVVSGEVPGGGDSVANSTTDNHGVQAGNIHGGVHFHPSLGRRSLAVSLGVTLASGVVIGTLLATWPAPAGTGAVGTSGPIRPAPSTPGQAPAANTWRPTSNTELIHACKLFDMDSVTAYLGATGDKMHYQNIDTLPDAQPDRAKVTSYTSCYWKTTDKEDNRELTTQLAAYVDDNAAKGAFDSTVAKMKKNDPGSADAADFPNVGDQAVLAPSGTWLMARKSNRIVLVTFTPPTGKHTGDFVTLAVTAASRGLAF
jgi:hypothetical protein